MTASSGRPSGGPSTDGMRRLLRCAREGRPAPGTVGAGRNAEVSGNARLLGLVLVVAAGVAIPTSAGPTPRSHAVANASRQLEVGTNDFRISDMGPDGDVDFGAGNSAVVYNPTADEYLVVWEADDTTEGEEEIFGQRLSNSGPEVGTNDFRISNMGPDGDPLFFAASPAVAYNSTDDEYLVVWYGSETEELVSEIFGQLIDASTGAAIGPDFGGIADMFRGAAILPAVAYNSKANEYLVVWVGDEEVPPLVDGEFEIFGQRLSPNGEEIGPDDIRISDMGPDGDSQFAAVSVAVVYNSKADEYLVVWHGQDSTVGENEIFGQRLSSAGTEVGSDFRISDMGPDGDDQFDAGFPAVVYNSTSDEYLVVWASDDDTGPLVDNEFEVFGQRLSASGTEIGSNDFRISDMGPAGLTGRAAFRPDVAYGTAVGEYLVVWHGDDTTEGESQIFGQRLSAVGAEVGANDFRISQMGPPGTTSFQGSRPAVAHAATTAEYLVTWTGDDDTAPLADNEIEVFGQRLVPTFLEFLVAGMESDGTSIWTGVAEGDRAPPGVRSRTRAGRR